MRDPSLDELIKELSFLKDSVKGLREIFEDLNEQLEIEDLR